MNTRSSAEEGRNHSASYQFTVQTTAYLMVWGCITACVGSYISGKMFLFFCFFREKNWYYFLVFKFEMFAVFYCKLIL